MGHWELPLVLFTILSQWAVGTAIILALLDQFMPDLSGKKINKALRTAGIAVFPLCAVALVFSIFHLGQPFAAFRALGNFGNSWLSREIWAFIALGLLSLVYSYIWWKQPENAATRRTVGLLTAGIGLIAVIVSSKVYTMPAHSVWNSWQTTASFLLSAVLLGSLTFVALLTLKRENEDTTDCSLKTMGWVTGIALVGILITLASFAQNYGVTVEHTTAIGITFSSWIFWFRMLFGLILPGAVAIRLISGVNDTPKQLIVLTLLGTVLGELGGRALFYYSVMSQLPF